MRESGTGCCRPGQSPGLLSGGLFLGVIRLSCIFYCPFSPLPLPSSSSFSPYLVYVSHGHYLCVSITRIFERIKGGKVFFFFLTRGFGGITMKACVCKRRITVLNFHALNCNYLRSTFVLDRREHLVSFIVV